MERLTERGADGSGWDTRCRYCDNFFKSPCLECGERGMLFDRLADYEDSGLMPEEFDSDIIQNAYDELAEYEVAEEEGRLLKLPIALGANFYQLFLSKNGWTDIVEWEVDGYSICNNALYIHTEETDIYFNCEHFGETLFSTKEEAEAKLKEMEDSNAENNETK